MTREGYGPCEVCGTPTRAMAWVDQWMCDGCQDDMAEFFYSDREAVARYIDEARCRLGERYDEFKSRTY